MQRIRQSVNQDSQAGFTLVELLLSLVITAILAVTITRILAVTVQSVNYIQTSTLVGSNVALVDSTLSGDISASNGFVIPNSTTPDPTKLCTSWKSTDTTYTNVRPLLTLSVPSYLPIASAVGQGSSIIFTLKSGTVNTFVIGQLATIYGFTNANISLVSSPITALTPTTITVATTFATYETETPAQNGTAAVNWLHGYEIRNVSNSGELWSFTCPIAGSATNLVNPRVLRQGVPLPSLSTWTDSVQCTSYSAGTAMTIIQASAVSTTCPTNKSLTSLIDNPGIQFTIPAAITGSRSNQTYTAQVIQGARSIA